MRNAALAFCVCAGRAAHCPQPPHHYGSQFPTLTRVAAPIHRLECAAEDRPRRTTARRSFSGAPAKQRVSSLVKGFQSATAHRVCGLAVITVLHRENRRNSGTNLLTMRVLLDCAPAPQGQDKPPMAGLDRPAYARVRRASGATPPKGGTHMTQQRQSQAVIRREVVRIGRPSTSPVHPGYAAIVAKAHALGLPRCDATDITILDRLQIARRQPRQFVWLLHRCGSLLSLPEPHQRPLDYLHATRRLYSHALPFWWDSSDLVQASDIDQLIVRMTAACAELHCKAEELV